MAFFLWVHMLVQPMNPIPIVVGLQPAPILPIVGQVYIRHTPIMCTHSLALLHEKLDTQYTVLIDFGI